MDVTSKYLPNKALEAKKCYGTTSIEHPAVSMITTERGKLHTVRCMHTVIKDIYCGLERVRFVGT